jgi:serine/threonine protein kinase
MIRRWPFSLLERSGLMKKEYEDIYNHVHMVKEQIGKAGGQGSVFRTMDPNLAVKLIHNGTDTTKNRRYAELRLLPLPKRINLTLPCAELKDAEGYVMMLLDDMQEFDDAFTPDDDNGGIANPWLDEIRDSAPEFADFIGGYMATGGVRRRLSAYLGAAQVLSALHAKGLVYCDFSGHNCFVSKMQENDVVWLIDADNLSFAEAISKDAVCTDEYAAPEVIQKGLFSPWSDCYSFAISLFKELMCIHPFMGALVEQDSDEEDFADDMEARAFQGEFPWICDQDDDSNSGDDGLVEQREIILTKRLFRLFDRTFSETGRKKRKIRPTMLEWFFALAEALDSLVRCQHCGMDFDVSLGKCPWCDTVPRVISLESRKGTSTLWKFAKEAIDGSELRVPARVIEGPRPSARDDMAFVIRCEKDGICISNMNPGYAWAVSLDGGGSFRDIFGHADIPNRSLVRCAGTEPDDAVTIEVRIE